MILGEIFELISFCLSIILAEFAKAIFETQTKLYGSKERKKEQKKKAQKEKAKGKGKKDKATKEKR
jgi:hypothetical protein